MAAALLHALQLGEALVELVVADGARRDAEAVEDDAAGASAPPGAETIYGPTAWTSTPCTSTTTRHRVDRDVVWEYLSTEAYWGRSRVRADVEAQLRSAWRVVGAYRRDTGAMVGFARAVGDGVSFAYLADVFVLPTARGAGLPEGAGRGHDRRPVLA